MLTTVSTVILVALLALACLCDVRERRIPNALTLAGLVAGLALRVPLGGGAVLDGLGGVLVALLLTLPIFALGFLGGGDVKLLAAVGAFVGLGQLFGTLALVAIAGGVLAVLEALRQRVFVRSLANTYDFAKDWVLFGRAGVTVGLRRPGTMTVPYGVAITAGTLLWWFLMGGRI